MASDNKKKTSVDAEINAFQNKETEICPSNIVKEDINNFYGYDPYSKYSEMYPDDWERMMREIIAVCFTRCGRTVLSMDKPYPCRVLSEGLCDGCRSLEESYLYTFFRYLL